MSSSKNLSFAVVICHGHYHTPEPYQPFLAALKARGIEGYCPQLPTSDLSKMNVGDIFNPDYDRDPPPDGYPQPPQDVEVVHEILTKLIEEESKSVILIGHSAGGFVATAAAIPSLHAKNRRAKGESGGIAGNFYECAILVPVGESVYSFFQPDKDGSALVLSPFCEIHKHGLNGVLSTKEGAKYFFNDLDETTARRYEATLTASQVPTTVLENDAYTALPCAYLVTELDLALPAAGQEAMIAMQSSRPGVDMTTYRCAAGHSPHLSWTQGFVAKVQEFAQKIIL